MATLPNLGIDLGFTNSSIRRMIFCLTTNDSGSANVISLSNAAVLANWQTQFNQYDHLTDNSDRFVCTPTLREVSKADSEPEFWEVEDYKRKMREGNADISASLLDVSPYILANLKAFEDQEISVFFIDEDCKAIGIKSGTDLKPFPIKSGSFSCPNWSPGGYTEGSRNVFTFRLDAASDLNSVVGVTIASADVYDDTDFYSLRDASATVSSPAVTGCSFTPTVDDTDPDAPGTAINIAGIVYGEIVFKDQAGGNESLASADSLTYLAGVYTVNEAALLTAGHTYDIQISHAGYNVVFTNACVVPGA
jgi:hypothetical protein